MTSFETDVLVVGGGPAGLAAAIAARQSGLKVLLADLAQPPIDKACGEGLMPDSLEALSRLGVSFDGINTGMFTGIRFLSGDDSVTAKFPTGFGRGIRRTLLHSTLISHAQQIGVSMKWGTRVNISGDQVLLDKTPVRYRWLIGADGNNSRIRRFARLDAGSALKRRIGIRRHYNVPLWSQFVEIYWGEDCQAYVTPVAADEVCVAIIASSPQKSFDHALSHLPDLQSRLQTAVTLTTVKGAITVSRRLRSVTSGNIALIGEASGSVDAITGEGLAMCFRQALALGQALASSDLQSYEREHRKIMRLPQFTGHSMLLMDNSSMLRRRTMRALASRPDLFQRMLSVHVGDLPLPKFGVGNALRLGWQVVTS